MDSQSQPPRGPLPSTSARSAPSKVAAAGVGAQAQRGPRRYPKPPGFLRWMVLLCIKPEAWAQAARYPTWVTLVPLLIMIVLGGLVAMGVPAVREYGALQRFAAGYDKNYPALELTSDATLRVAGGKGELKSPVRIPMGDQVVLVDPTGATHPETVSWDHTYALVTDKYIYWHQEQANPFNDDEAPFAQHAISDYNTPLSTGLLPLPAKGQVTVINGGSIAAYLQQRLSMFVGLTAFWGLVTALADVIWAAVMMFIMSTVIMQVAHFQAAAPGRKVRALVLPRRAAVRMVAGLLVPLVLVSTILKASGSGIADMFGWYAAPAFWMAAAMGLSVWAGVMARRMYVVRGS